MKYICIAAGICEVKDCEHRHEHIFYPNTCVGVVCAKYKDGNTICPCIEIVQEWDKKDNNEK